MADDANVQPEEAQPQPKLPTPGEIASIRAACRRPGSICATRWRTSGRNAPASSPRRTRRGVGGNGRGGADDRSPQYFDRQRRIAASSSLSTACLFRRWANVRWHNRGSGLHGGAGTVRPGAVSACRNGLRFSLAGMGMWSGLCSINVTIAFSNCILSSVSSAARSKQGHVAHKLIAWSRAVRYTRRNHHVRGAIRRNSPGRATARSTDYSAAAAAEILNLHFDPSQPKSVLHQRIMFTILNAWNLAEEELARPRWEPSEN